MGMVPFTAEEFFSTFAAYNGAVWPVQFLLPIAALGVATAVFRGWGAAHRLASAFLFLLWIWVGVAYHLIQFTRVTPAGYLFALLFVGGGLLFGSAAVRARWSFEFRSDLSGAIGGLAIAYALAVYPLLGWVLGHRYPLAPTFGAPCPSTIFTFGMLCWTRGAVPGRVLAAPVLWTLIGSSAAFRWGMLEDAAMPLFAAAVVLLIVRRDRTSRSLAPTPTTVGQI